MNFENLTSVDDVNKAYSNFQAAFVDVIDKHIPMKKMYHNKFLQNKSDANWEVYRKQRKLKRIPSKLIFMKELLVAQNRQHLIPPLNHFCQAKALNQTITLSYVKTKKL